MPVDAVLFDLDDTLCEYRRSGGELLELAFEDAGVEPFFDVQEYHARYDEFLDEAESMRELREACFGHDAPAKPDPAPFHRALDALDATPGRAVHVGNSLVTDVTGARAAGLRAAWLSGGAERDPDPDPRPDYRPDSLRELLEPPWTVSPKRREDGENTRRPI